MLEQLRRSRVQGSPIRDTTLLSQENPDTEKDKKGNSEPGIHQRHNRKKRKHGKGYASLNEIRVAKIISTNDTDDE